MYIAGVPKVPSHSPTHQDIEPGRLAALGFELEDIAEDGEVPLAALIELAEDRGRPPSHYLAAIPLATDLRVQPGGAALTARVCAGTCQRYGALDLLAHLAQRSAATVAIAPVACLDRCDQAPACELHGPHGQLVLAPATIDALDAAVRELT